MSAETSWVRGVARGWKDMATVDAHRTILLLFAALYFIV